MTASVPSLSGLSTTDQSQIRLVNQRRRLQRLIRLLVNQLRRRQFSQLVINQRQQLSRCCRVSLNHLRQNSRHVGIHRGDDDSPVRGLIQFNMRRRSLERLPKNHFACLCEISHRFVVMLCEAARISPFRTSWVGCFLPDRFAFCEVALLICRLRPTVSARDPVIVSQPL